MMSWVPLLCARCGSPYASGYAFFTVRPLVDDVHGDAVEIEWITRPRRGLPGTFSAIPLARGGGATSGEAQGDAVGPGPDLASSTGT